MPTDDDFQRAGRAKMQAKHLAGRVRIERSGRMDPPPLEWNRAMDLANAAEDVAYHVSWLIPVCRELQASHARLLEIGWVAYAQLDAEIARGELCRVDPEAVRMIRNALVEAEIVSPCPEEQKP